LSFPILNYILEYCNIVASTKKTSFKNNIAIENKIENVKIENDNVKIMMILFGYLELSLSGLMYFTEASPYFRMNFRMNNIKKNNCQES